MITISGDPLVMTFVDPSNKPLANGYVTFRLNTDGVTAGGQISAGIITKRTLDISGALSDSTIIPNNEMTPTNTFYFAKAYAADGQKVWEAELFVT